MSHGWWGRVSESTLRQRFCSTGAFGDTRACTFMGERVKAITGEGCEPESWSIENLRVDKPISWEMLSIIL